ncbi:MAG: hypothetical protein ACRD1J_10240 [Terriglobia bacterium]
MALIHRKPFLTEKELAARRANACKSTGPHTARGKARVALNSLKHGRYVANLREKLLAIEDREALAVYDRLARACALRVGSEADRREAERLTARVWCTSQPRGLNRSKLEGDLGSISSRPNVQALFRIRVEDPWQRLGVTFWRQRRRCALEGLLRRVLAGRHLRPVKNLDLGLCRNGGTEEAIAMEDGWRIQRYRMRRPSWWEIERLRRQALRRGSPTG